MPIKYSQSFDQIDSPAREWAAVDLSGGNVTFAIAPKSIFVGGAGNVIAVGKDGTSATFAALAGQILPICPASITASGTTATGLIALY